MQAARCRQAELLVHDYLQSKQLAAASKLFEAKLGIDEAESEKNCMAFAAREKDRLKYLAQNKDHGSMLELMLLGDNPADPRVNVAGSSDLDDLPKQEWTADQVKLLRHAIRDTIGILDKKARWTEILKRVGPGKTRKQCYLKFKELKAEKEKVKISTAKAKQVTRSDRSKDCGFIKKTAQPRSPTVVADVTDISSVSNVLDAIPARTEDNYILEDVCEHELNHEMSLPVTQMYQPSHFTDSKPTGKKLTKEEVEDLMNLIFPSENKAFSSNWENQGFCFAKHKNLKYGLVQNKGGPCGVLAVVQAYVIRYLFDRDQHDLSLDWQNPDENMQRSALASAFVHILVQASAGKTCRLVLFDDTNSHLQRKRQWMQNLLVVDIKCLDSTSELEKFFAIYVRQYMAAVGNGLVLFVLSVILTAGIDAVRQTMHLEGPGSVCATGDCTLIGKHDYCTQEIVNLLLCGHAVGNVFDGDQIIESDVAGAKPVLLRGIPSRGYIGFLSLFESYNYISVGTYLKSPHYNIWVVCSESHYSVLFMPPPHVRGIQETVRQKFDLYYYDGLGNQEEVIRLSVACCEGAGSAATSTDDGLVPPLNLVIQTKWRNASVDWNGTEPHL